MIRYRESAVSAYHNYLVNGLLTPGFVLGDPDSREGFFFLADAILPGEAKPLISARLFDDQGALLLELHRSVIRENPGECAYQMVPEGLRIYRSSGEPLLEVTTENYPNGHLTKIRARLFDETGHLRMEPFGEGIRIHGEARLVLEVPFGAAGGRQAPPQRNLDERYP